MTDDRTHINTDTDGQTKLSAEPLTTKHNHQRVISIQSKIRVGSIILITILSISILILMTEMLKIRKAASTVINTRQPVAVEFLKFSDDLNLATTHLNGYLLTGLEENKQNFTTLARTLQTDMIHLERLSQSSDSGIDEQKITAFNEDMKLFFSHADHLLELKKNPFANYPGLKLATETLYGNANAYLSIVNSLMSDLGSEKPDRRNYQLLIILSEIRFTWQQIINSNRLFMNTRILSNIDNVELYLAENERQFAKFRELAGNLGFGAIDEMEELYASWKSNWHKMVDIYRSDQWRKDSYIMKTEVKPIVERLRASMVELSNTQLQLSKLDGDALTDSLAKMRMYSGALLIFTLLFTIALAIAVSRAVIPPVKRLMAAAQQVAAGDLDISVPITRHDEVGELSASFNVMVNDLKQAQIERQHHLLQIEQWNHELENRVKEKVAELKSTQGQLLQSEKLASIGQLAAGVAHEINNPVGYINSNVGTLNNYIADLFRILESYEQLEKSVADKSLLENVTTIKEEVEIDYLKEDIIELIKESQEGVSRVKQIVQDLKDFSHVDEAEWQFANLHKGIDSTLNVAHNEIKYKADVIREYGDLPAVECMPSQINQVFMNLIVNAAHAIEERGTITIRSGCEQDRIWVTVTDTGKGIPEDIQKRIFEPFFTTKPVGKGTGLGLSLSYGIIEKHHGELSVKSEVGVGTTFTVTLPIKQQGHDDQDKSASIETAA